MSNKCYDFCRVHSKYKGEIRPKMGAPSMFPIDLERDLALFLKHCDLLRIPRTKSEFRQDIHHYVKFYNLTFKKLTDDGPGTNFCMFTVLTLNVIYISIAFQLCTK